MPLPRLRTPNKTTSAEVTAEKEMESLFGAVPGALRCDGDALNLPGWRAIGYVETDHDVIV